MRRVWVCAAAGLGIACVCGTGVHAQGRREVPVEQDLRRERQLERDIDRDRPPSGEPFMTPDDPDGVVGFDGPPDAMDDGVDAGGPLPPGSPADPD